MATIKHHPSPATTPKAALETPEEKSAWVLREAILMLRESGLRKNMAPDDIDRCLTKFQKQVNTALAKTGPDTLPELLIRYYRETGINLDDEAVRKLVRGAVRGVLKENQVDASVPGESPSAAPETVHVPKRPDQARREKSQKEVIERISRQLPAIKAPAPQPDVDKPSLTAGKLPTQLPPAAAPAAYDPRRSSAELPAIRERNVRDAFESAAKSMHRACQAAFPNLSDFLASAYRNPAQKDLLRKKTAARWDKWDPSRPEAEQDLAVRAELDRELEKCFREKLKTTHNLVDRKSGTEIHTKVGIRR